MKTEIIKKTNGIQEWFSLWAIGENGTKKSIDFSLEELKDLEKQIEEVLYN